MVVLARLAGGNIPVLVKFAARSLTLTFEMEGTREGEEEQAVKEQRTTETVCQSGALTRKMEKWELLILLERSCVLR